MSLGVGSHHAQAQPTNWDSRRSNSSGENTLRFKLLTQMQYGSRVFDLQADDSRV